jgi:hypothetical protein
VLTTVSVSPGGWQSYAINTGIPAQLQQHLGRHLPHYQCHTPTTFI